MTQTLEQQLVAELEAAFADGEVAVTLDGNRAQIEVLSSAFAGLSRVKQQQAVYAVIGHFVSDGQLHAVTIRARVPAA